MLRKRGLAPRDRVSNRMQTPQSQEESFSSFIWEKFSPGWGSDFPTKAQPAKQGPNKAYWRVRSLCGPCFR